MATEPYTFGNILEPNPLRTFELTPNEKMLLKYEDLNAWHKSERVEAIIKGKSKRRTGLTQDEIATLFAFGIDGRKSSTGNFRSENGILWHYSTIEALRTKDGLIISNRDCWNAGFAYCSKPPYIDYSLNLSTMPYSGERLKTLEIIDHVKESQNGRSATLLKISTTYVKGQWDGSKGAECTKTHTETDYLLNAYDDNGAFVALLKQPCKTVKEAFETMKPKIVRIAEQMNLKVKRQGEFFFIPTQAKNIRNVQKRERSKCVRLYFQCEKCGLKTKSVVVKTDSDRYHGYHPKAGYWSAPPSWTKKQIKCAEDHGHYDEKDMKAIFYDGVEYSEFPEIVFRDTQGRPINSRHTATRLGRYLEVREHGKTYALTYDFTVTKGIIRHPEHQSLKLGEQWHIVAKNNVKRSWSARTRGVD